MGGGAWRARRRPLVAACCAFAWGAGAGAAGPSHLNARQALAGCPCPEFNDHVAPGACRGVGIAPALLSKQTFGQLQSQPETELIGASTFCLVEVDDLEALPGQADLDPPRIGILECIADHIGDDDPAQGFGQDQHRGLAADRNFNLLP